MAKKKVVTLFKNEDFVVSDCFNQYLWIAHADLSGKPITVHKPSQLRKLRAACDRMLKNSKSK